MTRPVMLSSAQHSTAQHSIPIVFICDDGYIIPTCVAISSIASSKNDDTCYDIYIVSASLTEKNEALFVSFSSETVVIHIIREDAGRFVNLHDTDTHPTVSANHTALLKFILPDLFPDYEKILYLDGDVLVKDDLTSLYHAEIGEDLVGAVFDSAAIYNQRFRILPYYFNSGVMLLNIGQMRFENIKEALIKAKKEHGSPDLMDQDAFNYVCAGRIHKFPIRYNLLAASLEKRRDRWTPEIINKYYSTEYTSQDEVLQDGVIIHFVAGNKPWKNPFAFFADDWFDVCCPILESISRTIPDFYIQNEFIDNVKLSRRLEIIEKKFRESSFFYHISRAIIRFSWKVRKRVCPPRGSRPIYTAKRFFSPR